MHKKSNSFSTIHLNFVCILLVLLFKLDDFEIKSVQFARKFGFLLVFQNLTEHIIKMAASTFNM